MRHAFVASPALDGLLPQAPDRAFALVLALVPVRSLASSRTTGTDLVRLADFGSVVRKRWSWPRRSDRIKGALRTTWAARSPARREFEALARLCELPHGGFAPPPLAWLERRERGVLRECALLLAEVKDASDLANWLLASRSLTARARVLRLLARRTRAMHDAGLVDREMHPRNVLVAEGGRALFKVDCAKQRRRRGGPAARAGAVRDLAALDVGLARFTTASERTAFFASYLGPQARAQDVRAFVTKVERARRSIDERESRRLPSDGRVDK